MADSTETAAHPRFNGPAWTAWVAAGQRVIDARKALQAAEREAEALREAALTEEGVYEQR